jgi:hypothetical protein
MGQIAFLKWRVDPLQTSNLGFTAFLKARDFLCQKCMDSFADYLSTLELNRATSQERREIGRLVLLQFFTMAEAETLRRQAKAEMQMEGRFKAQS